MQDYNLEELKEQQIAVLCGGVGTEVEVSLDSGSAVTAALNSAGLKVQKVVVDGTQEQILNLDCDLAFLALHGLFGEDGTVQSLLERKRIPFTGSNSQVSKLCMNKHLSKILMQRMTVPVAQWICIGDIENIQDEMNNAGLELPVIVKPNAGGSSVGVVIARSRVEALNAANDIIQGGDQVIIEEYVPGVEFTVGLLAGEVLPMVEMNPHQELYDYHAKYNSDKTEYLCPPERVTRDIQAVCADLSKEIYRNFKIRDMARVDYILGNNGKLVALEINTIPGFTSHSLLPKAAGVAGIDFAELCLRIVNMAYLRRR